MNGSRPAVLALTLSLLATAVLADARNTRVATVEPITEEMKIHPSAYGATDVNIYFHNDVAFEDARAAILASGGALEDIFAVRFSAMRKLRATIPSHALRVLAADDRVLMISGPRRLRPKTYNSVSASLAHVTELQAAPYGLTGAGVAVSLFELAAGQGSHIEFGGRLTVLASGGLLSDQRHATHVAGTIGATGVRFDAKGMAPKVTLTQFCVPAGTNACTTAWQDLKDTQLTPRGVVVDNNSWGYVIGWNGPVNGYWVWEDTEEFFGAYDYEFTAPVDQIARDRDILFVFASGNEADGVNLQSWGEHYHVDDFLQPITSRLYCYSKNASGTDCPAPCTAGACETVQHHTVLPYDSIAVSAAAKNAVAVGAVDTAKNIMSLSSRGPAKDGRIKPDVVARGSFVLSSVPTNAYDISNGTSMASPVVTGIAALLTEQWRRTFSATPKPAHLKAVILAGAEDLGNPGPDYTYGFGLVNAKTSADLIIADGAASKHIRTTSVAQGQQIELPIVVQTAQNVRVILQWTDPPIFLPANQIHTAKALVNNLDLKVIGPSGETHLPYVLDKVNYTAAATRGVNTLDNTEMVEIANAAPGVYRIQVAGTGVPQGPQEAVVVSNIRAPLPCVDPQEGAAVYGDLVPNQTISGGLCAAGDVDSYKFTVSESGAIAIDVTAGDTPLRLTLSSAQVNATLDVPAYATRTLTTAAVTAPLAVSLQIAAAAAPGVEPSYAFTPKFGQFSGTRRRSVRK